MCFIENVKKLCTADFSDENLSRDQKQLKNAVKLFISSKEEESEKILRELFLFTSDDEIRNTAQDLIFAILLWQDQFDELSSVEIPRNAEDKEQIEMYDIRDTDFWLSSEITEVDMPDFPWIHPIMPVKINGKVYNMLIDTGALITVVTKSVAEYCSLITEDKTIDVAAATEGSVASQTARISELVIGKSIVKNKRCIIIPDEALDFSSVGGLQIDGIIGWEVIQRLYWEIDYQNRKIKVRAPYKEDVVHNMCCDFFPMVNIEINKGEPITIGFDTGGVTTNFGKSMVGRFSNAEKSEREMMGAGQSEPLKYSGYVVPELMVDIAGSQVILQEPFVLADSEYSKGRTLVQAGALGSDVGIGKVLIIDYYNRHLGIR